MTAKARIVRIVEREEAVTARQGNDEHFFGNRYRRKNRGWGVIRGNGAADVFPQQRISSQ
jgi:hypothetical protein